MFGLLSSLVTFVKLGPRQFIRQKVKLPFIKFIHDTVNVYKSRTKAGVNNIRDILFRGIVIATITAVLVWLSIFMYVAFYYVYVPTISHERPVHLKFKCDPHKDVCSYPSAHVALTKRQQLLMSGQPYQIHLDLEMPESPKNRDLGMFMVCADFRSGDGELIASSCRSTMLHYRGVLLDTIYKLIFSPLYVLGTAEEKQHIVVELFSDFEDKELQPVTDIYIEVQSKKIEIYSAKFLLNANFAGLRYVMFNWSGLSAVIGITANLFFIALVCLLSWYQIINSEEYLNFLRKNDNTNSETVTKDTIDEHLGEEEENGYSMLAYIGSIYMSPIYFMFDFIVALKRQYVQMTTIPKRIISYRPKSYAITSRQRSFKRQTTTEIKCGKCKKEICALHRKGNCVECLKSIDDVKHDMIKQ
ncbi:seipin isoform X2 [Aethina tumida]|uniref:seipin isoform X2 n=1 Tax=Aethina tumida TaxID=116153 RepID=UPI0021497151|nr:seipin isoform X2 [Aethina tumida]